MLTEQVRNSADHALELVVIDVTSLYVLYSDLCLHRSPGRKVMSGW
jgi:hypothetical protein